MTPSLDGVIDKVPKTLNTDFILVFLLIIALYATLVEFLSPGNLRSGIRRAKLGSLLMCLINLDQYRRRLAGLNCICKLMERLVHCRLTRVVEDSSAIRNQVAKFLRNRSTAEASDDLASSIEVKNRLKTVHI